MEVLDENEESKAPVFTGVVKASLRAGVTSNDISEYMVSRAKSKVAQNVKENPETELTR